MIKKTKIKNFYGFLFFFLTMAVVISVSVLIYSKVKEADDGNNIVTMAVMLLTILFFSLLCSAIDLFRRRITVERSAEKILDATEKIAEGDFSVRLEPSHKYGKYDEYDLIMENLNVMVEELGKSEMLKNDFISNVSHEMKTPLTVIQNYATAMQNDKLDNETRKKYAQTLVSAAKKLSDLIVNILKLDKLENSAFRPETEIIRLDECLADAVLDFENIIEEKELELDCDFDEITVRSSPSYLEIVWNNLISNAVKFTEKGGRIGVKVKQDGADAVVTVTDTGCGISSETGKRIFEKFYQGDASHSSEGNGLGLALVKRIVDILGGRISVKSELGKGSVFTVTLKGVII